jgi:hypothetical protein
MAADPTEQSAFSPAFLWLLRDFYLQMVGDHGQQVCAHDSEQSRCVAALIFLLADSGCKAGCLLLAFLLLLSDFYLQMVDDHGQQVCALSSHGVWLPGIYTLVPPSSWEYTEGVYL